MQATFIREVIIDSKYDLFGRAASLGERHPKRCYFHTDQVGTLRELTDAVGQGSLRVTSNKSQKETLFIATAVFQQSTFRSAQKAAAPAGSFVRSGSFSKRPCSGMMLTTMLSAPSGFSTSADAFNNQNHGYDYSLSGVILENLKAWGLRGACGLPPMRQQLSALLHVEHQPVIEAKTKKPRRR